MSDERPHFSTRALLREHRRLLDQRPTGLKKTLGQHLLAHEGMLREIARQCKITAQSLVIEIGAGVGNLTQALLEYSPAHYVGIELDQRFRLLHERFFKYVETSTFIYDDILQVNLSHLTQGHPEVIIVGNIPYQITSPLIMKILSENMKWDRIVFTIQKEVAERLTAPPGTRRISGLSIKVSFFARAHIAFLISASNFIPPPRVDSAVIVLTPRQERLLPESDVPAFFRLIEAAYGHRRKTIVNSLYYTYAREKEKNTIRAALERSGISPEARAETLSLEDFIRLFHNFQLDNHF